MAVNELLFPAVKSLKVIFEGMDMLSLWSSE